GHLQLLVELIGSRSPTAQPTIGEQRDEVGAVEVTRDLPPPEALAFRITLFFGVLVQDLEVFPAEVHPWGDLDTGGHARLRSAELDETGGVHESDVVMTRVRVPGPFICFPHAIDLFEETWVDAAVQTALHGLLQHLVLEHDEVATVRVVVDQIHPRSM